MSMREGGVSGFEGRWLIGVDGLYAGSPGEGWTRVDRFCYPVNAIVRTTDGAIVGAGNGVWKVRPGVDRWLQLHDETVTEVLDVMAADGEPGVVVAFPYGVGTAQVDDIGMPRWTSVTEHLEVNDRYTNVIRRDPETPSRWLAGTEAGVVVGEGNGASWAKSDLAGTAVRGLAHLRGAWWAATDERGVWRSDDGMTWRPAGKGLEERAAFCLAATVDGLIVGTEEGVAVGDGEGAWRRTGPRVRVRVLRVDPADDGTWVVGADPGGLWFTRNRGDRWENTAGFNSVRAIDAPGGA